MPRTYLPTKESDLVTWSTNFQTTIISAAADFGLTEPQVTDYRTVQNAFVSAHQVANESATRSPANIEAKNTIKKNLIAKTRELVNICQAWPEMTNDKRSLLQITIPDTEPTPAPVPDTAPVVTVAAVEGRLFDLELRKAGGEGRAKPAGVRSAWIYTYVGEDMPTFEQMTFRGAATKTDTKIVMPQDVPVGSKVWISACWVNTADKPGPVSLPIFTWTDHGSMQNDAA